MSAEWDHDALAADLKMYLEGNRAQRFVWLDMQLGPAGSPRPDVYALPKRYSTFNPIAYEVKVARSDFQSDINSGKWQKYYAFASAVVFAVPDGLVKKTEMPDGAGLIVRKANVWRMARAPRNNPLDNLPIQTWMKLLLDGVSRLSPAREAFYASLVRDRVVRKLLGDEIAALLRNRDHAEHQLRHEQEAHERRLAQIKSQHEITEALAREREAEATRVYDELCEQFGLRRGAPTWQFYSEIRKKITQLDSDERVQHLVSTIENAERALAQARLSIKADVSATEAA